MEYCGKSSEGILDLGGVSSTVGCSENSQDQPDVIDKTEPSDYFKTCDEHNLTEAMCNVTNDSSNSESNGFIHPLLNKKCAMDDPHCERYNNPVTDITSVPRKIRDGSTGRSEKRPRKSASPAPNENRVVKKVLRKKRNSKTGEEGEFENIPEKEHSKKRKRIKVKRIVKVKLCKCGCKCDRHTDPIQSALKEHSDESRHNSSTENLFCDSGNKACDNVKNPVPSDCTCVCKNAFSRVVKTKRPEPEGGDSPVVISNYMDEYDAVINSSEPIFSDLEYDPQEDEDIRAELDRYHKRANSDNIFSAAHLVASNTMMKFAIISAELQNILKGALQRVTIIEFYFLSLMPTCC